MLVSRSVTVVIAAVSASQMMRSVRRRVSASSSVRTRVDVTSPGGAWTRCIEGLIRWRTRASDCRRDERCWLRVMDGAIARGDGEPLQLPNDLVRDVQPLPRRPRSRAQQGPCSMLSGSPLSSARRCSCVPVSDAAHAHHVRPRTSDRSNPRSSPWERAVSPHNAERAPTPAWSTGRRWRRVDLHRKR